ncbi:MAG: hypothetical protein K2R98_24945 [Gemmataceae bacterium]|nr:hypothetical protein [Gemmataceae bacterium]
MTHSDRTAGKGRFALAFVVVLWYAGSLFLPVFYIEDHSPQYGIQVLMFGWFGLVAGIIGWFANPLFLFGLLLCLFCRFRTVFWLSAVGLLIALTSFSLHTVGYTDEGPETLTGFGAGFYCWLASLVLLTVGSLWLGYVRPRLHRTGES